MSISKTDATAKEKAATQSSERKTLDLALSAINKQYGDGTLMRMGDATKMTVSTVSTGSVAIDLAVDHLDCFGQRDALLPLATGGSLHFRAEAPPSGWAALTFHFFAFPLRASWHRRPRTSSCLSSSRSMPTSRSTPRCW